MKRNKLINKALSRLTTTQLSLFHLLTNEGTQVGDVKEFVKNYDIDNESAIVSFFINDLLDRFDLSSENYDMVPRIRGLKEYFRFHNASAVMKAVPGELIVSPDLILKIRYPEDIRPFIAVRERLSMKRIEILVGKRYCKELVNSANSVCHQTRMYIIPGDSYVVDLLFLNLRLLMNYSEDSDRIFCNIYDIFRYCPNQSYSNSIHRAIVYSVIRKTIRKMLI